MEQKHVTLEEIYRKLLLIEQALQSRGFEVEDEEGELTDEFKAEIEKRRKTPESEYISLDEVKKTFRQSS